MEKYDKSVLFNMNKKNLHNIIYFNSLVYSGAVLHFFKLWFFLSYLSVIIFSYLDNNLICDCMMNYSSSYTLY
jgi:hypothetical protein